MVIDTQLPLASTSLQMELAVLELTSVISMIDAHPTPNVIWPLAEKEGVSCTPTEPLTDTMSAGGGRLPEALSETSQLELMERENDENDHESLTQLLLLLPTLEPPPLEPPPLLEAS